MVSAEMNPAYIVRAYAWAVLKANDPSVWSESNYGGTVPIVPVAEEPELEQFAGPHIVYGYLNSPTGSLYARKEGSVTFVVYDTNFRRLTKTINILTTAFERQDESATDINRFSSKTSGFIGMNFGWTDIGLVEGGSPETTEGGRQSAIINIRYEYHVDYNNIITNV